MASKLKAAEIVMRAGIPMPIGNGMQRGVLAKVLAAEAVGTVFLPGEAKLKGRKRWIAFFITHKEAWWWMMAPRLPCENGG